MRAAPADLRRAGASLGATVARAYRALQVSAVMAPLLEAPSLTKFYTIKRAARGAKLHAVDNVDLMIGAGESVGLVGESGCGKSTIVRLLGRLIDPTAGQILLDGEDITAMSQARFVSTPGRRRIQVVFQDATESLNPSFRAFQSIADPLKRLLGLRKGGEIAKRVRSPAALVGLPQELLQRYPHQLSGGQRARVGIARAVAVEPSLLILDEPTLALDGSVAAVLLRLRARRVGPGRDPAVARRSARAARDELPGRVARAQRGAASVFARGRDVSRQDRRDRAGGGALHRTPSPLYAGAGCRDPGSSAARQSTAPARRQSDQPDRSGSQRLPLLRPLSPGGRHLHQGDAAASRGRPGSF